MEKVKLERQLILSYDSVYEDHIDLELSFRGLPQKAALEFISYLLHLFNVRKKSDGMFQSNHLMQWMMNMGGQSQQRLVEFVTTNSETVFDPKFKLLERRPCLDMIQHLLVHADCDTSRELDKNDYGVLFRLLLIFNSRAIGDEQDIFDWDHTGTFQQFADAILKVQIRNIENERFKNYVLQFLKVYYFFNFCETSPSYAIYLKKFLDGLSLRSYKSYLWMLLSPYLNLLISEDPTPKMHMEGDEQFLSFYYRLVINNKTQIDKDYKSLRSFPLYLLEDKMFLFLDFRFFVDKFYNGFLFDFSARTGLPFGQLKKTIGNDFSERVLFYTVMQNCFEGYGDVSLTGDQLKQLLKKAEPDYYIRQGSEIFLFEFKDILLSADVKYADSIEKVKKGLLEKLEIDSKGQRKGISQILNSIKEIRNGKYAEKAVDLSLAAETVIFPIIVHTDISLEAYGVNYFLNQGMHELAHKENISLDNIQNLTLINLDNLLLLQDHFKSGKLELADCLKSYCTYVSSGDPVNDTIPFDEFVKHHFVSKNNEQIGQPSIFKKLLADFQQNL